MQQQLIDPNLQNSQVFMDQHLAPHTWFAGDRITLADFQMSFAVEALLARGEDALRYKHVEARRDRMVARPADQWATSTGGPVLMG
jgi:glutathione S-transferase